MQSDIEFIQGKEAAPREGESFEDYVDRLYCDCRITCFGLCVKCLTPIVAGEHLSTKSQ